MRDINNNQTIRTTTTKPYETIRYRPTHQQWYI